MEQKIELTLKQSIIGAEKKLSVKIDPSLDPLVVIQILTGVLNNVVGQLMQMQEDVLLQKIKLKE
jgi:hypothetical protein